MPSLGAPEIVVILVIALLVFGPRRLPEMGRSLGRAVREFKKASDTARQEFGVDEIEREIKDVKTTLGSVKGDLKIDIDAEASKPTAAAAAAGDGDETDDAEVLVGEVVEDEGAPGDAAPADGQAAAARDATASGT
jgi:sec-independent protein translocase protein TatA